MAMVVGDLAVYVALVVLTAAAPATADSVAMVLQTGAVPPTAAESGALVCGAVIDAHAEECGVYCSDAVTAARRLDAVTSARRHDVAFGALGCPAGTVVDSPAAALCLVCRYCRPVGALDVQELRSV